MGTALCPAVGERGDHEEAATGLGLLRPGRRGGYGDLVTAGVTDRDAERADRGVESEGEAEVTPSDPAVQGRVRGEFGDELLGAFGDGR
ncbi:hypothetical protein Srubr_36880 [Streptomyces rubradiris]|uniref:Uncharacterized protein n=1 Tax=Streptomyces rubradiris TaxID=285531 RepID=A0ABQ3RDB6_STRRR|nr:hypothetical protein GCM10018792_05800 [Streptomyces rubradiris]GHI53842.1 hypothetical protein Srubr_36880 [Streptomyces rubradiris]